MSGWNRPRLKGSDLLFLVVVGVLAYALPFLLVALDP